MKHGKRVCDYYDLEEEPPDPIIGVDDSDDSDGSGAVDHETNKPVQIVTGGTRLEVFRDEENDNEPCFRVGGRSKHADATKWVTSVVDFLVDLQGLIQEDQPSYTLDIFTEHSRDGVMFRGHPNHRGTGPWKDWVLVDWVGYGPLPSRIWCFVKLSNLPKNLEYGGIKLQDGVYAVVEVANYEHEAEAPDQQGYLSDLFIPLRLELESEDLDGELTRRFYLANTDAFKEPVAVVPDIGGPPNRYFLVKSRSKWCKEFCAWLQAPHTDDVVEVSDDELADSND